MSSLWVFVAILALVSNHASPVLGSEAIPAVCRQNVTAKVGDSCASVAAAYGISVSQFVQSNPSLKGCTLTAGAAYCVSADAASTTGTSLPQAPPPPSSTGSDTPPASSSSSSPTNGLVPSPDGSDGVCGNGFTCLGSVYGDCCSANGYCGNTTDYCGDGCNPTFGTCGGGISPACGGAETITVTATLPPQTVTATKIVTTAITKTVTATAPAKPSPTLADTNRNCNRWYLVKQTDNCRIVAREYGITLTQLYSWNPNFDCDDIDDMAGNYICVGVQAVRFPGLGGV